MGREYPHLRLSRWPFPIVPDAEFCTFLAARKQLQKDVHELVEALARRDPSSMHLFWAWFGAGKTHTVKYLSHYATKISAEERQTCLIPVYTEFPKGSRSFLDLYRSMLASIDADVLSNAYLELVPSTEPAHAQLHRKLQQTAPDLIAALHVTATGEALAVSTAFRWLRGDSVPMSDLRKLGIVQRTTTSEEATRALTVIVSVLNAAAQANGRPGARLIWIIDEFQRIRKAGARGQDDINAGLHSSFNACPNSLSFILSFSGRPELKLPDFFSRELRDRVGRTKVMVLPPMASDDGLKFISEVLAQFRTAETPGNPFFPFTEASCKTIIADVESKGELKPRSIMHACNAALQEAEPLLENKELVVISVEFARKTLAHYVATDATDEDEEYRRELSTTRGTPGSTQACRNPVIPLNCNYEGYPYPYQPRRGDASREASPRVGPQGR